MTTGWRLLPDWPDSWRSLGLADGELDQMITMLQSSRQEAAPEEIATEGVVVVG